MVNRTDFVFLLLLFMGACATAGFKFYGLQDVDYSRGMLLGPKASDDLHFTVCAPTEKEKHPCVVLMAEEFFALKQDYEDTKQKLKECEKHVNTVNIP